MDTEEIDAAPDSSPATGAQTEVSPNSPDVAHAESSNAGEKSKPATEIEQLDSLLEKEAGEAQAEESPTTEDAEASAEEAPNTDEPGGTEAQAQADDLSHEQQQEQLTEKAFAARPEWQEAIKLVPPDKQKVMRQILRTVLGRESKAVAELQRVKPDVETVTKLRTTLGEDAVSNGFALMELWHRGDPKAKEILTELLTDLDTRTGARLSSPDLVKRAAAIQEREDAGLLDATEAEEERKLLLELERTRAGLNQTKEAQTKAAKAEAEQRNEVLVQNTARAIDAWEKTTAGSDPDYAKIQKGVINRAKLLVQDKLNQVNRSLQPGEMVDLLKQAYTEEKAYIRSLLPARRKITPLRGNGSSTNSRPKPKTAEEQLEELLEREKNG